MIFYNLLHILMLQIDGGEEWVFMLFFILEFLYETLCAIGYHFHNSTFRNLKNVENSQGGVIILVLKLSLLHGCFSSKSRKASHIFVHLKQAIFQFFDSKKCLRGFERFRRILWKASF